MNDIISEILYRIDCLERQVSNVIKQAKVTEVNTETGLVSCEYEQEKIIKDRPFFTRKAGEDKDYWLPSVGELGLLISPSGDLANAIFIPGINYINYPLPESEEVTHKIFYRDEASKGYNTETHQNLLQIPHDDGENKTEVGENTPSEIKQSQDEVSIKVNTKGITLNTNQLSEEHATKIKSQVGPNNEELTSIAKSILGALFYNSGITSLQCPVGPVMFAPAPAPASAPSAPSGSSPNSDGEVTKTPPSQIRGVSIQTTSTVDLSFTSQSLSLIVATPIPVTTPAGPGTITTGTYPIRISGTPRATVTGTVNLEFPARSL